MPAHKRPFESFFEVGPGCWEWQGSRRPAGYGRMKRGRRDVAANRASWEFYRGPIPDGLFVLHHCDNPPCVNPDHLWLGTLIENNADRDAKGRARQLKGDACSWAKLNHESVEEIRRLRRAGQKLAALAAKFGVSEASVCRAARGSSWA